VSLFLLLQDILLWHLCALAKANPAQVRPIIASVTLASVAGGIISWCFIFPLPAVFSAGLTVCLALALFSARRTTLSYSGTRQRRDAMNIILWVLQVLLALAFMAHGWMFLFPPASLLPQMNSAIAPGFRLFIGAAEVLAAVGLTLPGITRIQTRLVPYAAAGLMIVTISATVFHISRGELSSAVTTAILFALLTFVAYMRWKVVPMAPRAVA
jgi:uncharacterized membrane protein YphA (DoxX/SURF4 family)